MDPAINSQCSDGERLARLSVRGWTNASQPSKDVTEPTTVLTGEDLVYLPSFQKVVTHFIY